MVYVHWAHALKPEYHGKGLGKNLLRTGIQFGIDHGMPKAMLSVTVMVCYKFNM